MDDDCLPAVHFLQLDKVIRRQRKKQLTGINYRCPHEIQLCSKFHLMLLAFSQAHNFFISCEINKQATSAENAIDFPITSNILYNNGNRFYSL
ncbi:hypothetical protein T10_1464 [Trichinella papuae]|uniref:Uncharacterized protein n=1 Tax=Trichinella papuae TaxID=268474 RepID=A0A0V1MN88_9BILA|nr:hypothetical protein T10_1464 [Trichinella papuae]